MGYIRSTRMSHDYIEWEEGGGTGVQKYEVIYCDGCGEHEGFIVAYHRGWYQTIGRCINCGHTQVLHEG